LAKLYSVLIETFKGFEKYLVIAGIGIIVIYSINYVGVELLNLKPRITYFFSTFINYVISYFGNARIFGKSATKNNLIRFLINATIFLLLTNYFFHIFLVYFEINYIFAITLNFIIFPLIKFISYGKYVFK
jgi:hypothetical protein